MVSAAAVVSATPKKLSVCPRDFDAHQRWHAIVKLDASLDRPTTVHGAALRASRRWWADMGMWIGECLCKSSLHFLPSFEEQLAHRDAE